MIAVFEWLLYIKPSAHVNVSEILYQSLKWNPDLKMMARTDQNALMLEMFQKVNMISTSLSSVKMLLEEYERRAMLRINREILGNKCENADDMTIALIYVMKHDIR